MSKATRPFELEIHLIGGTTVRATVSEDAAREMAKDHPRIDVRDRGERHALATIVYTIIASYLTEEKDHPLQVVDGESRHWMIPTASILALTFRDPLAERPLAGIGFGKPTSDRSEREGAVDRR